MEKNIIRYIGTYAGGVTCHTGSTWEPVVGEQSSIRDCYNETSFTLSQAETGLSLGIQTGTCKSRRNCREQLYNGQLVSI